MKIFLVGLSFMGLLVENSNGSLFNLPSNEEESCQDCRIELPPQKNSRSKSHVSPSYRSSNACQKKTSKLRQEIRELNEKLLQYKEEKEREIRALQIALNAYEEKTILSSNRTSNPQRDNVEREYPKEHRKSTLPKSKKFPWLEIVVDESLDIYELALKYYGAYEEYYFIYLANKNVLGNSTALYRGMTLRLPINEKFRDQPLIIETK